MSAPHMVVEACDCPQVGDKYTNRRHLFSDLSTMSAGEYRLLASSLMWAYLVNNIVVVANVLDVNTKSHGSTLSARFECVEEVCKRLLEVGRVVLQHVVAAATRQIALE